MRLKIVNSAMPMTLDMKKLFLMVCGLTVICLLVPESVFAVTYAYVPNYEANTVSVIRTSDNYLLETIPVGNGPFGAAFSPYGEYVYVTNRKDGTISVISTSENEVTDTVKVGNDPMGIAVGVGGAYIFVANRFDNTVSIVTASGDEDNNVLTTIQVGEQPYGIATDPDGEYVYVTNYGDSTVTVFSFTEDPVSIEVGQGPMGIATDKAGEYVYVANSLDNTLTVINVEGDNRDTDDEDEDLDDNQVVKTISVGMGPWGVSVLNNMDLVYVTNNSGNTVTVMDALEMAVTATIGVGSSPMGIATPLNGNFAYVVNNGDNSISVIDGTDNRVSTFDAGNGNSPMSLGNFIGGPAPETPLSLYAEDIDDDDVELAWIDYSFNELGFVLERREYDSDEENEYEAIAILGSNVTTYTDAGLNSSKTYQYRLKAYNEAADSEYTSVYSVTTGSDAGSSMGCFIRSASFF